MAEESKRIACMGAAVSIFAVIAVVIANYKKRKMSIPREPHIHADAEREYYINSLLCRGERHCIEQLRMRPSSFYTLCDLLSRHNLLRPNLNISVKEQLMLFLQLIGQNVTFRHVSGYFYRSVETVHRYFRIVLKSILKLYKLLVNDPGNSTPPEILYDSRFYPYFKDCVGAIDGTHVQASVPIEIQGKFRGRKDGTTQNVLAAITFDLKFSYVLSGWEGSAHDSRVLNDALSRCDGLKITEGKYYLGDAGYGIRNGIISPYRSVRYHLNEYDDNPPTNEKELFNLRHSTLRTTIERGFGILKKRFRAIDVKPQWSYATQVDVVLASCILHNFIMGVAPRDFISDSVHIPSRPRAILSRREEREENREWSSKRDMIASCMWNDYINNN